MPFDVHSTQSIDHHVPRGHVVPLNSLVPYTFSGMSDVPLAGNVSVESSATPSLRRRSLLRIDHRIARAVLLKVLWAPSQFLCSSERVDRSNLRVFTQTRVTRLGITNLQKFEGGWS